MNRLLTIVIILLIFAAGCGGGKTDTPAPQQSINPPAVGDANKGRLDPSPDPSNTGVTGEIKIQGFTVIDENQSHVGEGDPGYKVNARLLDPGDDILSATITDNLGKYQLLTATEVISAKLEVEVNVAEDVNGDGVGNDTIIQALPVKLVAGTLAEVKMTISAGNVHNVADPLLPTDSLGVVIVTDVERQDASGFLNEFYASFPEGLVYFDDNNNGFIEPGADTFYDDADLNGVPDPAEDGFGMPQGDPFFMNGMVVNVDEAKRRMVVKVDNAAIETGTGSVDQPQLVGTNIVVELVSFATMEILGSDPDPNGDIDPIDFSGQFLLDAGLIGRDVFVEGFYDGTKVFADLILQVPSGPGDIPEPPGF